MGSSGASSGGGALALIGSSILADNTHTSVTFPAIADTYNHLNLRCMGRSDKAASQADAWLIQFNGDTAAHYDWNGVQSTSAVSAARSPGNTSIALSLDIPAASATAGVAGYLDATIFAYAQTTFDKLVTVASGYADGVTSNYMWEGWQGLWRSTAAITSITVGLAGGTTHFLAGSAFYLYGLT